MDKEAKYVDAIALGYTNDSDDLDDENAKVSLKNFNLWADFSDPSSL